MRKLILLDHSLAQPGGHHFELTTNLGMAAARAGFEVIVAAHRRFAPPQPLPGASQILRVFEFSTYKGDSVVWGRQDLPVNPFQPVGGASQPGETRASIGSPVAWWARFREAQRRRRQRTFCRAFQRGCERLLESVPLHAQDIVLLPTVTEFDLVGLAYFLQQHPPACQASWHLWFHNPFLEGHAEPERNTWRTAAMTRHFQELLAVIPGECRLYLHATTRPLADQYNTVLPGRFDFLPYVVAQNITVVGRPNGGPLCPLSDNAAEPLRIVCAGGSRADKGRDHLSELVADLWEEFLAPGRLQLRIQMRRRRRMPRPPATGSPARSLKPPLVHVHHPLDRKSYAELVRTADCGLFLYDAAQYATRCSAVLIEMLCCGIPVLVPAGSWLADEIAAEVQAHRETLVAQQACLATLAGADLAWLPVPSDAGREGQLGIAPSALIARGMSTKLDVPLDAAALCISVGGRGTGPAAACVRGELHGPSTSADRPPVVADTVRLRGPAEPASLWLPVPSGARQVNLRLGPVFSNGSLAAAAIRLKWIAKSEDGELASSRVGLIVSDRGQFPRLFRELLACYPHYRQSAMTFATAYRETHTAEALLQRLVSAGAAGRSAAA